MRRLAVLMAVAFVDMMGLMIIWPLLPLYAVNLHATPTLVGLLAGSFPIAQLASSPVWGYVSDRHGRRPALLVGLASSAFAYVVFGFTHTLWLLFLSRFVQGLGGGTTGVVQAYVADSMPPAERAKALGWLSAATSAGVIIGPAIGSFMHHFGDAAPGVFAAALGRRSGSSPNARQPFRRLRRSGRRCRTSSYRRCACYSSPAALCRC